MYVTMDWQITVGAYKLALLAGVEVHRSVDLLADTCTITLPGYAYNAVIRDRKTGLQVEELVKRGDAVNVLLGYNGKLVNEFTGYLLNIDSDDDSLKLNCEDALFLFRKAVANKQFKGVLIQTIAQYLIQQTGLAITLNCTLTIVYDKFVINNATAFDVLKLIQDECKANVYMRGMELNIHPPYIEKAGSVRYSFQRNIEASDLKYKRAEDRKLEITAEAVGADGKKKQITVGTTGGDKKTIKGNGINEASLRALANAEYLRNVYDGYEGDITTWLVPYVEPAYSAEIKDDDYEYKDGWYYVTAVTTNFNESGGQRKVQLGIKVSNE